MRAAIVKVIIITGLPAYLVFSGVGHTQLLALHEVTVTFEVTVTCLERHHFAHQLRGLNEVRNSRASGSFSL